MLLGRKLPNTHFKYCLWGLIPKEQCLQHSLGTYPWSNELPAAQLVRLLQHELSSLASIILLLVKGAWTYSRYYIYYYIINSIPWLPSNMFGKGYWIWTWIQLSNTPTSSSIKLFCFHFKFTFSMGAAFQLQSVHTIYGIVIGWSP